MILARLLGPEQYGLIAMAGVFMNIAYMLADGGFGNALVQKDKADNIDYSTVFYFNIGVCGFIYLLIFACAPLIADFFREQSLVAIVRVSSLGIILVALGQIQSLIFKKEIDFKTQVKRDLICQLISVIVAVIMAYRGYGVWALVAQGISYTLLSTIMNWFISSWRPILVFSFNRLSRLFNYGSKTLAASLIDYSFRKAYEVIVGRVYSPVSLGLYNRAYSTAEIFRGTFFGVFSNVTFPLFVKMQDDNVRLIVNIRKFLQIVSLIIFTVMGCVIALSTPIFQFMYSAKWDAAIDLFCIACISAMITPVISILESIILAKGYSGKFLFISIVRKVFVVASIAITWSLGVMWLMIGQMVVTICECLLYTYYTNRIISYSFKDLYQDIWNSVLVALFVSGLVYGCDSLIRHVLDISILSPMIYYMLRIIIGVCVAVLSFIVICKTTGIRSYNEFLQFIEDSIGTNKIIAFLKAK